MNMMHASLFIVMCLDFPWKPRMKILHNLTHRHETLPSSFEGEIISSESCLGNPLQFGMWMLRISLLERGVQFEHQPANMPGVRMAAFRDPEEMQSKLLDRPSRRAIKDYA
jgi:hypothetical protein